ncbi:hypothetical protein L2755_18890, partial [Shewanella abyssi]|uniref:hypothetical protein n=1 Tax=Shewanella abyssi TaxID=311789 RepID=UPI00200F3620
PPFTQKWRINMNNLQQLFNTWLESIKNNEVAFLKYYSDQAYNPESSAVGHAFGKWLNHNDMTRYLRLTRCNKVDYSNGSLDKEISRYRAHEVIELMKENTPIDTEVYDLYLNFDNAASEIEFENYCFLDDLLIDLNHNFEKLGKNS